MHPFIKKLIKTTILILGIFIFFILGSILYLSSFRWFDLALQRRHLRLLSESYNASYEPINEENFLDFDPTDTTLRLNDIQLLASHNSYKKRGSLLGKFFIGLGDSFKEARKLQYGLNPLTTQLNDGIRSFELDMRYRKGRFEAVHVPLVDNSSQATNVQLALEEIDMWSDYNPDHIPIILLLELKNDWMMLDPALSDFDIDTLTLFDQMLRDIFGNKLLSPKDLISTHPTLNVAITTDGWPLLIDTLGKIIVVLHPGDYTDMYVSMDTTFQTQVMFPAASNTNTNNSYASFIVHNEPDVATIQGLVDQGYIVRTRVDDALVPDTTKLANGLESGAQILTSDFIPNHKIRRHSSYTAYLKNELTMILNTYLQP